MTTGAHVIDQATDGSENTLWLADAIADMIAGMRIEAIRVLAATCGDATQIFPGANAV